MALALGQVTILGGSVEILATAAATESGSFGAFATSGAGAHARLAALLQGALALTEGGGEAAAKKHVLPADVATAAAVPRLENFLLRIFPVRGQPEARTEMLRLNVEALARQPGRVDVFRATAENVCANLLNGEAAPPADLAEALAQLQRDLAVLCPPEPGQYLVDDARALAAAALLASARLVR